MRSDNPSFKDGETIWYCSGCSSAQRGIGPCPHCEQNKYVRQQAMLLKESIEQVAKLTCQNEIYRAALDKLKAGPGNRMQGWKDTWAHQFSSEALAKADEMSDET